MKCTCADCLNELIDKSDGQRRFFVSPVITEMEFTEYPLIDETKSIPTTYTFTLKPNNDGNIVDELLKNGRFFWLDMKTRKQYPIKQTYC